MHFFKKMNMFRKRTLIFTGILFVALVILAVRLFYLQVIGYDKYREIVVDQLTSEVTTTPVRGKIYDCNMNLLVTNTTVYTVFISPYDMAGGKEHGDFDQDMTKNEHVIAIANKLVEVLGEKYGVTYDEVIKRAVNVKRKYEVIAKEVDADSVKILRDFLRQPLETTGEKDEYVPDRTTMLCFTATNKRHYCYDTLACHVLGFTDSEGSGIYGVEASYDDYLKGESGKYITARDGVGNEIPFKYESYIGAENGANLVTTLDMRIQYELEAQLKATYEASAPDMRACGLVLEPSTGAIKAMAVYPPYDCNNPRELTEEYQKILDSFELDPDSEEYAQKRTDVMFNMWTNKCISEIYEPGSTFKPITASVALEIGAVSPTDEFYCSGSYFGDGFGAPIHCHQLRGHGAVTFARGLQQSCNPTLMQTIERIGKDSFYQYFVTYGYTGKTGVDLPGEVSGIYYEKKDLRATELANYSFGQSFKTTPLQQMTALCTIANGGYLVTPHILKELVDDDGNVIYSYQSEPKVQILSEDTCKTLTAILVEGVATDGGAKNAYVAGYDIAAKTGTSQKLDKRFTDPDTGAVSYPYRVGSTIGYAPADDAQLAALIMVDEPTVGGSYGAIVAAPYIAKFFSSMLPYIGIEPVYGEGVTVQEKATVPNLVGKSTEDATLAISNRKIGFKIIGNGDTVTGQFPPGPCQLSVENGTVYLYTENIAPTTVTVPDVVGTTAKSANITLVNNQLNVSVDGSQNDSNEVTNVISQSPAAGTEVKAGTVVTISVAYMSGTD